MLFSVAINVVCTLLTPLAAKYHYIAMIFMRIGEGIFYAYILVCRTCAKSYLHVHVQCFFWIMSSSLRKMHTTYWYFENLITTHFV